MKPLQQPLFIEATTMPALCNKLSQSIENIIGLQEELTKGNCAGNFPDNLVKSDKEYIGGCCSQQRGFSVQEQTEAGCIGSDTVGQCMDKLIKSCLLKFPNRMSLKHLMTDEQNEWSQISIKATQLSEEIKRLLSLTP
jgi:hypothetical protein